MVRAYGAATSEQDIEAALGICHESFSIETVAFGVTSQNREDTALQLAVFFDAFPDYSVTVEGLIVEGSQACLWGRAKMTLLGGGLGIEPTGKTADVPIFCVFEFRDGLMASERFFFDLADLCTQIEVPVDVVTESLAVLRAAAA